MEEVISWIKNAELSSILSSAGAASLAVLIEIKRHTWVSATVALASGVFLAYIAATPIVNILNWGEDAEVVVAATLGISGRNLIMWLLISSKDPLRTLKDSIKK